MPDEINELYSRNSVKLEYPKSIVSGPSVMERASEIEKQLDSKFDVIISDTEVKNNSKFVKVFSADELPVEIMDRKMTDGREDKISAYINANSKNIISIDIPENESAKIGIMAINSGHMPFQILVRCGSGSRLNLFEYYCSANQDIYSVAPLHEFMIASNAHSEFSLVNNKTSGSCMMGFAKAEVYRGAELKANFVYSGSSVTKMKSEFYANEEGSRIDAKEIIVGASDQKFDINTFMTNAKPNTYAKLESGAVLDGSSMCMLKGYAKVEKLAKGAISRVEEHGILLSEAAHIDALPDMAIDYGDGVSATHSAATAPIDKDALFYIMSRGIDNVESRRLFVGAFMSKYLAGITNPLARELATSLLLEKAESGSFGKIPGISMKNVWNANW